MIIKSLELKNFRNYESLGIAFDAGTNILYGDNAQGKTNVLESLYVSGTTKSHKGSKADLEKDCTEEEFMAMYEQYEAFDDFEDEFISEEEEITEQIARYVDGHIGDFAEISQDDGE